MRARHLLAAVALVAGCTQALTLSKDDSPVVLAHQSITAPNPGEKGSFSVRTLYYGSGTDKQRAVYRDSVTYKTRPVDASPFVSMDDSVARQREGYWGFPTRRFPLNGR